MKLNWIEITELSRPAQIRGGEALVKANKVEILESSLTLVRAKVLGQTPGASTRRTELRLKTNQLSWRCTCTKNPKNFCKHLVATALKATLSSK